MLNIFFSVVLFTMASTKGHSMYKSLVTDGKELSREDFEIFFAFTIGSFMALAAGVSSVYRIELIVSN